MRMRAQHMPQPGHRARSGMLVPVLVLVLVLVLVVVVVVVVGVLAVMRMTHGPRMCDEPCCGTSTTTSPTHLRPDRTHAALTDRAGLRWLMCVHGREKVRPPSAS